MKTNDKVAIALTDIEAGTSIEVVCQEKKIHLTLKDSIAFGHKFAVVPISEGEDILKYGEVIGVAVKDIDVGVHVHVHNLEGKRGRGDKIAKS